MKSLFFFTFIASIAKAGLWISIGILIKNHFDTFLSLIIRKPIPENLISEEKLEGLNFVLKWIGIILIIIGITIIISSLLTLNTAFNMNVNKFNFKH